MDLPLTAKRIAIDEVGSKMDYVEHQFVQRYGGDHDVGWRAALKESEGVEYAANRAIWNEPDHHLFHIACSEGGLVRLLLERDIKHVIPEGIIPDIHHREETEYVAEVRQFREEGSDGIRRMRGLLEEAERELLIEYIHDTTGQEHPGWISDSLFRMWREHHGFWGEVTYNDWRNRMTGSGMPFTNGPHGTAALQRHFLLTTDARAATMKERLEQAKHEWNSASISKPPSGVGRPSKKVCIRMFSKKPASFSGGSGEESALKDLTSDSTRRLEEGAEHPSEGKGVEAILKRRLASQSEANRDMSLRKAMVTIGTKPEERQPLSCILLGSLSGVHEFTVAMIDTGCTAYSVVTQDVMRYLQKNLPECIVFVKEYDEPLEIDTCSASGAPESPIRWQSGFDTSRPRESRRRN